MSAKLMLLLIHYNSKLPIINKNNNNSKYNKYEIWPETCSIMIHDSSIEWKKKLIMKNSEKKKLIY